MAGDKPTHDSGEPSREGHADTIPASEPPVVEEPSGSAPSRRSSTPTIRPSIPPPIAAERYRLGAELGRGGMGRVVEAFDVQLGRTVALKEVLPKQGGGGGTSRRFAREVQLTARLEHPSIVPLYDAGTTADGRPFYVMRRVSGRPLDELISRARGLGERLTLLPALLAAIDAVAHAHRRGVIHRDLKPANILVGELGETIVIDWGLAKVIGEEDEVTGTRIPTAADSLQTQMGAVFGTPGFMAPEQARGDDIGAQGDVYALGATLYQLLAGKPPHVGHSATEVIDKTLQAKIPPLAEVAPGSPADLVTIVEKALAHDQAKRYPNAGALGEDVRRFLAGQLVAAHRYTPAQRVVRFARRHRAPLAVAALATVTVAALAWFAVARIVSERDKATEARAEAIAEREAAEQAHGRLAERHDALIVTQARARLDTNATEAAAILKQLSAKSQLLDDARMVAQAAAMRGIAWAMQSTTEHTIIAELSPDGQRLLQVSRDGAVRVWDVDRRRLILVKPYPPLSRALWVSDDKVLITSERGPAQLLDPATSATEPTGLDSIEAAVATARGDRVAFAAAERGVAVFDVASRKIVDLAPATAGKVDQLVIADDGSWIAIGYDDHLVVVDGAGRELARRPGRALRVVGSPGRSLAILAGDKVHELRLDPQPVWTEVPYVVSPRSPIVDLVYRDAELVAWLATGELMAWDGTRVFKRMDAPRISSGLRAGGNGVLLMPSADGRVHFATSYARGSVALPSVVPNLRLAVRRGSSRVIGVGNGLIVGFELDAVLPRRFPLPSYGARAVFADNETLLVWRPDDGAWQWLELATGKTSPIAIEQRGLLDLRDVDASDGRVLVRETYGRTDPVDRKTKEHSRLLLLRRGSPRIEVLGDGKHMWGRLLQGGGLVFGTGDSVVLGRVGDGPPRELGKVEGKPDGAVPLGPLGFALRSTAGEVIRGHVGTGAIERVRVPIGTMGAVGVDGNQRVLLAEDHRLMVWDGAVTELARFDKPILGLAPIEGGVVIALQDLEVYALEVKPDARPERILAKTIDGSLASRDGKLVVGTGNGMQLTIVEMPARVRWTLPLLFDVLPMSSVLAIAPDSRRIAQTAASSLILWDLPAASTDLGAWLDERTSATIDPHGLLAWPWQLARTP